MNDPVTSTPKDRRTSRAARRRPSRARPGALTGNELVLLGLVAEEPTHAYRVEEKIRERHMSQWTEIGFSSIYRLLAGLERRGFARSRLEHEGQGPTRKVLEATRRGRAALSAGVVERLDSVEPVRMPFQVGLAFVTHATRAEALQRLDERRDRVARAVNDVERFRREVPRDPPGPASGAHDLMDARRWITARLLLDHIHAHLEAERTFVAHARRLVATARPNVFSRRR